VRTPGVQAPQNPFLGSGTPNLPTSRGYEGMAISQDGMTLFPMLEGTVTGDPDGTLRIYDFDVAREAFTGKQWLYPLSDPGHAIGELTQINDEQFLVIERDWNEGDAAAFKKVFRIDLTDLDPSSGQLRKTEILDLLAIADPYDLNMDGLLTFDFPFVTIESILPIDAYTVLIANDNNYPFSRGRTDIDDNEIILVRLDQPLAVPVAPTALLLGLGLALMFGLGQPLMLGLGQPLLWRRRRG
jgi:glycerophosphoryl diester phosphodiesterase